MQLGIVGLGKMGSQMCLRLVDRGIDARGFDPAVPDQSAADTLEGLIAQLDHPRVIWSMVPAGSQTGAVMSSLADLLDEGDLVIDGSNARYTDDRAIADLLGARGIGYLDCGVSGGTWGRVNGYALMVGGDSENVATAMPVFDALRPDGPRAEGFVHAGPTGAGHCAKMIHNGIEYGLMHAYAEGYELLRAFEIIDDPSAVVRAWKRGTVIRSWLLELLSAALDQSPQLTGISDHTEDSGEGRWTVEEAIRLAVPTPVISAALFARFASRQAVSPAMQAVAALRYQFGGHGYRVTETDPV